MENEINTLYGAVLRSKNAYPESVALHYMSVDISYARFLSDVDAVAGYFTEQGIAAGDVVTLCMPNIPQCVVCFYALSKLGAVAHMVHPLAPEAQLDEYMNNVHSKMLVVPDIMAKKYPNILGSRKVMICSPAHYLDCVRRTLFNIKSHGLIKGLNKYEHVCTYKAAVKCTAKSPTFTNPEATAVYLHSGGTGGKPKTIELSSKAINALTATGYRLLCVEPDEMRSIGMLAVLPMFHGFGLAMGVHAMLYAGGTDVLMPKFHTADTIKLIKKNRVHCMIGVPVLFQALLSRDEFDGEMLTNLRSAFVGGDYVPQRLLDDFNARMADNGARARLFEGYGLTETVTVCSVNTIDDNKKHSIGKPIPGATISAFSDDKPLPAGEIGELCIAGDTLMNAYLGDDEGTKAVFFTHDGVRYVRSGDMGYVDEEGYVFFKSRVKRMAKVSGIPIFPSEIERLCMDEVGFIKEAHAAAVPDEARGSAIVLFVVLSEEVGVNVKNELTRLIESRLSVYAKPRDVIVVDSFPQTLVGKVDSNALVTKYVGELKG